ncbi:MAG: PQQ-dependent sugar dehydrogenase [Planctomycetes bacterium]|nr:PQQ-dependent sugar dehydrogenase [Planctomycetota bacterium]
MKRLTLCFLIIAALLAGCAGGDDGGGGGSGGGGGGIPDPGPRAPLPSAWVDLDYYFGVELIKGGLNMPVKLAQAPDGRLFVSLLGGEIVTIGTIPPYNQTSWATLSVLGGSEQGLLGIALSPNFASDDFVYVMACVHDMAGGTDEQQVIRYTDSGGIGTGATVIVQDLPTANVHNGGAIRFLNDGTFVISVGDAANMNSAQTNGSLAGRVLRYDTTGNAPADNPFTGIDQFEWCRGLRNSFGLCVHPGTGTLLGTENGPNNNDELNYLVGGKNYTWPDPHGTYGSTEGVRIQNWGAVIVPTGLTYHTGTTFPQGYADNLFVCSYDEVNIRRMVMDGSPPVNIDTTHVFGELDPTGNANKPLDIIQGIDGSLYLSTFTGIWRIYRRTGP